MRLTVPRSRRKAIGDGYRRWLRDSRECLVAEIQPDARTAVTVIRTIVIRGIAVSVAVPVARIAISVARSVSVIRPVRAHPAPHAVTPRAIAHVTHLFGRLDVLIGRLQARRSRRGHGIGARRQESSRRHDGRYRRRNKSLAHRSLLGPLTGPMSSLRRD